MTAQSRDSLASGMVLRGFKRCHQDRIFSLSASGLHFLSMWSMFKFRKFPRQPQLFQSSHPSLISSMNKDRSPGLHLFLLQIGSWLRICHICLQFKTSPWPMAFKYSDKYSFHSNHEKGNERITCFLPWCVSLFLSTSMLCALTNNNDSKNT